MQFGFGLLELGKSRERRDAGGVRDQDFVIARAAESAPSRFIFFDGSETLMETATEGSIILPGGAFFLNEARSYLSEDDAVADAERLNDASPCLDRPWIAMQAGAFHSAALTAAGGQTVRLHPAPRAAGDQERRPDLAGMRSGLYKQR